MLYLNYSCTASQVILINLTLTSVVFESDDLMCNSFIDKHLTLTSVVFELIYHLLLYHLFVYLTLTSVVFESKIIHAATS